MNDGNKSIRRQQRPRHHWQRLDPLIVAALLTVVSSFAVGYKLDWKRTAPPPTPPMNESRAAVADNISASVGVAFSGGAMTPEKWRKMTEDLGRMVQSYPAPVSVYLQDFKSGATWTYRPDEAFRAASLIKLPLMAAALYKVKDGGLSLDQRLTLSREDRAGGSGTLKWSPDGASFTVQELLFHLISESDNTAANMLLRAAGLPYVQERFADMGLSITCIHEEGMSLRGGRVEDDNYTTAREMNMLLTKIYRGELIDAASSRLMLDILRYKKPEASRLAVGLPSGWTIAHKTGLERRACHDAAVFLTPDGDYALTVLTGDNYSYRRAKHFITHLGELTFAYYGGRPLRPLWLRSARRRYYARAWRRVREGHAPSAVR